MLSTAAILPTSYIVSRTTYPFPSRTSVCAFPFVCHASADSSSSSSSFSKTSNKQTDKELLTTLEERHQQQRQTVYNIHLSELIKWEPFCNESHKELLHKLPLPTLEKLEFIRIMYNTLPVPEVRKANLYSTIIYEYRNAKTPEEREALSILVQYYGL